MHNTRQDRFIPYEVFAEATPNPAAMKFFCNHRLAPEGWQWEFRNREEAKGFELIETLFQFPFVEKIFVSQNFLMIYSRAGWDELYMEVRNFIREHLHQKGFSIPEAVRVPLASTSEKKAFVFAVQHSVPGNETEARIIEILDEYIRPGVEMDGGFIAFRKLENKKLFLELRGSCQGCPSSQVTLKSGIENILKRILPDVVDEVLPWEEDSMK